MNRTLILSGAVATLTLFPSLLSGQSRDFRSQRLLLDDNGADGISNTVALQTSDSLLQNSIVVIPDPGEAAAEFLLTESALLQTIHADMEFAGAVSFSSGLPDMGLVPGQLLFGDPGGGGAIAQSGSLLWNSSAGLLELDGDLDLHGSALFSLGSLSGQAGSNLELISTGSLVINIDDDNSGTGSRFAVETNGSSDDLFAVTETGFTSIASTSGTGGLRVANNNAGGTAPVLELTDGTSTTLLARRNGTVGIGTVPDARLDIEESSAARPALQVRHSDPEGIGLEIADGGFAADVQEVTGGETAPDDAVVIEATGTTFSVPAHGVDGQIIYVVNTTDGAVTVNGLASDGTDASSSIPQGGAVTILRINGVWYATDRN